MMNLSVLSTEEAPAAVGPYSQGRMAGNMLFTSGMIPIDPATGTMADTIEGQTEQVLKNLFAVCNAQGPGHVVKVTVFLADICDFAAMNAVYARMFQEPYPARSCVAVKDIPKGAKLMVDAVAIVV